MPNQVTICSGNSQFWIKFVNLNHIDVLLKVPILWNCYTPKQLIEDLHLSASKTSIMKVVFLCVTFPITGLQILSNEESN